MVVTVHATSEWGEGEWKLQALCSQRGLDGSGVEFVCIIAPTSTVMNSGSGSGSYGGAAYCVWDFLTSCFF